jgi:hypothetical protein
LRAFIENDGENTQVMIQYDAERKGGSPILIEEGADMNR